MIEKIKKGLENYKKINDKEGENKSVEMHVK